MPSRAAVWARAVALRERFEAAGARVVETPILQPAETLLDLYGEDIRARAYVTSDALRGEQMLRPDFTVPVVQMHMAEGAEPARYTYAGEVFRRQEHDEARPNEYVQVGYEVFDRTDPARADAEVFALFADALSGLDLTAVTGDIGILMAAVNGLNTTAPRRAALMRHIWRPARFRALLERYAGRAPVPKARAELIAGADLFGAEEHEIGKRTRAEIAARVETLRADAAAEPIDAREIAALEALLDIRATLPDALIRLTALTERLPALTPALDRFKARNHALAERGVDVTRLIFEASYGRTSMEYYDGFVFGFSRPAQPPVATGGRYDALTRHLGRGAAIPAVGGVLRPALMLGAEGAP